ncbi:MAG: DUF2807 domain-containing protein [Alistipes sp.]|nr:DUF2807 domain-containing protein [Alistipes sp.]MBR7169829.1 DUF2807 domain-containing protein [Alistipes sp.]
MKSYIIALWIALVSTLCTYTSEAAPRSIKGSGVLVTRTVTTQPYTAVKASRAIKVTIQEGTGDQINIEADDNLIDYVETRVEKGCLVLTIDNDIQSLRNTTVRITLMSNGDLEGLHTTSAASIECRPQILHNEVDLSASSAGSITANVKCEECEIDCSSSGNIRAEIRCNTCDIEASSSGEVKATLVTRQCDVECSSAGQVQLKGASLSCEAECSSAATLSAAQFAVKHYQVDVSSAGHAKICCVEKLQAEASSGGSIRYTGGCQVTSMKSSSGGSIHSF